MKIDHVLDSLGNESIDQYPSIEDLNRKYGRNNVCAERMKLKLDLAKYLNIKQQKTGIGKNQIGYLVKFKNVDYSFAQNLQGMKVTCF